MRSHLFVRVHELPDTVFVGCASLEVRDELLAAEPDTFYVTPHYAGYPGVLVRLGAIDVAELGEILTEAWRLAAPKRLLAQFDAEHPPVG